LADEVRTGHYALRIMTVDANASSLDPVERRARGHRLVVIFAVVFVLFVGGLGWRWWSGHALDGETDDAIEELRVGWRSVDLAALAQRYATNAKQGDRLIPRASSAALLTADFGAANRVDASYVVDIWGRQRCLYVRATGPVPNRIQFQKRDGGCHA
jgi:hypothetical protein